MRALLVARDPAVIRAMQLSLTFRSHELIVIEQLSTSPRLELAAFGLVVIDCSVAELDVLACCRDLRATGSDAWLLLIAESRQSDLLAAALDAGADDYHLKGTEDCLLQARLAICERRVDERALQRKERQRLGLIVESGVIGIAIATLDGVFVEANDTFLKLIGYTRQDLEAGALVSTTITPPEWHSADNAATAGLRSTGMAEIREKEFIRKDGARVPVIIAGARLDGSHVIGLVADNSRRKKAEEALDYERDILDRFFTLSLDLLCIVGADGYFKRVNSVFSALGYSLEELCSRPLLDFVYPEDRDQTAAELAMLSRGVPTTGFESRWCCKDGSVRWLLWTVAPDSTGVLYGVARDITYRKEAEEALRRSEEQARQAGQFLETVIETIPNMVFLKDADTLSFVHMNRAGEELLGISRDDLLGKTDDYLFPAEEAQFFEAKDRETLRTGTVLDIPEEPIQTSTGIRLLHTKKVPILDARGKPRYLMGISEDVTELKAGEQARSWLAALVSDSDDAIIGRTLDGVVTSWNRGAERVFGFSAEEIIGRSIELIFPESRREEESQLTLRLLRGERIVNLETVRRRKDGNEIDISITLSPVRDPSGSMIGVSAIARDITERKRIQRELVRAKDATESANRELEAFSYSVAHDLRAPLRSIDGFSQALLEDYADKLDQDGKKYLEFVRESAQLMAQLIDDMLRLSGVTRTELTQEDVDLSSLARAALTRLSQNEPNRQVDLLVRNEVFGRGDRRLLAVVLENLLGNAWKFASKNQNAKIEFGVESVEGSPVYFVRDNGVGFDMAYKNKLFGAFQRLHGTREFAGSGVGLATVQRIIRRHGGRVWAEGVIDEGATFYFTLSGKD